VKSAVETLSDTRVRLSVEVPFDELQPSVDSAYKKIAAQITVPGFRKGKVPQRVIDQRVGRGAVLDEAVNEALPKVYGDAITENELKVLGQPDVEVTDFADGSDLKFTAEVDIRPKIDIPAFDSLVATVDDVVVAESDIDEQVEALQGRFATVKPVERPAANDDMVTIDLKGEIEGEPIEDLSATGMSYQVGSGNLLENLDESIVGLSEGDDATFTFTPEGGEHGGKAVTMTVTVTGVKERELPALDDEFAQTVSEFDTLAELRDQLKTEIEPRKQVEQLMAARDAILKVLLEAVEVPVPEGVIAAAVGDHFEDGHGDDGHKEEYEAQIRETITRDLVLDTIADQEAVEVSQAELSEYLVRQAPQYGMTPDQFAQALAQSGQVTAIFGEVRRAKALSVVLAGAVVTDASGKPVDLSNEDPAEGEAPEAESSETESPKPEAESSETESPKPEA
jgi:trigger factor